MQHDPQIIGGDRFVAVRNNMQDQAIAQLELSCGMFATTAVFAQSGLKWQFAARVFFGPCRQRKRMVFPDAQFDVATNSSVWLEDFLGDHDVAIIVACWQVIGCGLHSVFVGFRNGLVLPGDQRPVFGNGEGKSENRMFKNACHARDHTGLLKLGARAWY